MSKNTNSNENFTVEDVVAKATEEKLVTVPTQSDGEKMDAAPSKKTVEEELQELCDQADEKKSFKSRLESMTEKLKENKKTLLAVGAAVTVATIAFAKFAKKQATEVIEMSVEQEEHEFDQAAREAEAENV